MRLGEPWSTHPEWALNAVGDPGLVNEQTQALVDVDLTGVGAGESAARSTHVRHEQQPLFSERGRTRIR